MRNNPICIITTEKRTEEYWVKEKDKMHTCVIMNNKLDYIIFKKNTHIRRICTYKNDINCNKFKNIIICIKYY
jgi:hypothetical protein